MFTQVSRALHCLYITHQVPLHKRAKYINQLVYKLKKEREKAVKILHDLGNSAWLGKAVKILEDDEFMIL